MKKYTLILITILLLLALCSCAAEKSPADMTWEELLEYRLAEIEAPADDAERLGLTWYQVFVYSFYDSDGDGIGDLNGVTQALDYIQGMGFDGIWLSPVHPSSTYHKYNVRDYFNIDPEYGTLDDFDALIEACHTRGMKVLIDMVVNHSDFNHPWFTEHPEYYSIADEPGNGNWQPLPNGRYYECQFWDQMPDFDLENTDTRATFVDVFAYWLLERGVDGFRLDATGEYVSGNTEKNIEILTWLNNAVKDIKPDAYIVGEFWETTNVLYDYYESGIDSFFSFPFAGSDGYVASVLLKNNATMEDYLQRTAAALDAAIISNPTATNAPFLTNHDMARASGFLRRDPNLIKTAWGLSLTQPGNAFVYYGEELGMSGSGRDENKRAPMFWTDDIASDIHGMTYGPPEMEQMTHGFPPATEQISDPESIYAYVRDAVMLRRKYPQIGSGSFEVISAGAGDKSGAVLRTWHDSSIVVAYNVSSEETRLTLQGTIADVLSATGEQPRQDGDNLILPGYCIVVLT